MSESVKAQIDNCIWDLKNYAISYFNTNMQNEKRDKILKHMKRLNDELFAILGVDNWEKTYAEKMNAERVEEMDAIRKACDAEKEEIRKVCDAEKEEIRKVCDAENLKKWEKMNADKLEQKTAMQKAWMQKKEHERYYLKYANKIGAGFYNYNRLTAGKRSQRRNNKKTNKQAINKG